jgi:hypothetical protein
MEVGANEGSAQDHKNALKNKGHANFLTGTNMAKKRKRKKDHTGRTKSGSGI